jgi:hypothetical protein
MLCRARIVFQFKPDMLYYSTIEDLVGELRAGLRVRRGEAFNP